MAGLFKKILKGVLIGGGTVLSAFSPSLGAAVVTAGMNVNTAANPATETKTAVQTMDQIGDYVMDKVNTGVLQPAMVATPTGLETRMVPKPWMYLAAAGLFALLLFKKK